MNSPLSCKTIVKYPADEMEKYAVSSIVMSPEYQNAPNFRTQCFILKEQSKKFSDKKYNLTYDKIGDLFDMTGNAIKKHYLKAVDGELHSNSRPFSLNNNQLGQLREFIETAPFPPPKDVVKNFIEGTFHKILDPHSLKLAFTKAQLFVETASPMDEKRYYADQKKIDYFYSTLGSFCNSNSIPSHFVLNLDEEGHEEYSDSKKIKVVVTEKNKGKDLSYPVTRKNDHTTFLACITAGGKYLNPLMVVKRKTIDARFFRTPIIDQAMIGYSESGFINSELFNDWLEKVLVPYMVESRKKYQYSGPAVLLLDGCSSHITTKFFEVCEENMIKVFFLPAHSSNQTQPLDLGIFHLHKEKIRCLTLNDNDTDKVIKAKLRSLYSSFQSIATLEHIQGAFEAAGAVYELSNKTIYSIIHWSKDFATKLLDSPLNRVQKKELKEKRDAWDDEKHEIRVKFEDINGKNPNSLEKILKCFEKVPQIIDPTKNNNPRLMELLLMAIVPEEKIINFPSEASKKGRPKKDEGETVDFDYYHLSFFRKLNLELESLGLL